MTGATFRRARVPPPSLTVPCPYCKAGIGEVCHVDRRNVSIAVLGVHKPRAKLLTKRLSKLKNGGGNG